MSGVLGAPPAISGNTSQLPRFLAIITFFVDHFCADHTKSSGVEAFRLRHGDVVELMDELQQNALKDDWMYGRCERTGLCGGFPYDSIYILPTCVKPPSDFMVRLHALFTLVR